MAGALQQAGWEVWGTSRQPQPGAFPLLRLDLADPRARAAFTAEHEVLLGSIDLLVNNAGYGWVGTWEQGAAEVWERQMQVLLHGPVDLCRKVLPGMVGRGAGTVVNVSSLAVEWPLPFMPAYNAGKAALSAFSATLALELRGTGVAVVDFRPGDYRTRFNETIQVESDPETALGRAWERMQANVAAGPEPAQAARDLLRAVAQGRSGIVRSGNFFQRAVSPWGRRLLPSALQTLLLRRYYRLP